jgi:hypothetical protein
MKKQPSDPTIPDSADQQPQPIILSAPDELPPVLAGQLTPQIRARTESFYAGVAEMFERWVARRPSPHTQRAYRRDVLSFAEFRGIVWPEQAAKLLLT